MENNNYNIKQNIKKLSSEDIAKHQDFDSLLQEFQATEVQKPIADTSIRRLWQIGMAAAAVLVGIFVYSQLKSINTNPDAYFASQPYVNPPIKDAVTPFTNIKVDGYEGGTYEYKSGSKIVIPPRAFVNRSGNFAMGEVDIKYREYHDYIDFFMSGIPMEYDSAGVRYILESAGMIEVFAEQNGERLEMAPEKTIEIQLISEINVPDPNNPPSYNIYRLDKQKRNWVYNTTDDMEVLEKVESAIDILGEETEESAQTTLQNELANIENRRVREENTIEASVPKPRKPIRPSKGNSNNFSFDLDILDPTGNINVSKEHSAVSSAQQDIANLQKQYEGLIWEVLPNQPQFNESTAQTLWEDFKLEKVANQEYQLVLIEGTNEVNVKVKPVLMGEDYDNAMASFEAEMAHYNAQIKEREDKLANRKRALQEAILVAQETANLAYEAKVAALRKAGRNDKATDEMFKHKVLNKFTIASFGIWNCDRPLPPYIYALNADFQNQFNKKYEGNIAFFVDKKRNTVNRFHVNQKTTVNFDKTADNLMWVVTDENKLAVYRPEDFKTINYENQNSEHTFVLNLIDKEINSEEDARSILQF